MIKVRLQIGEGAIEDTYNKWGLIYLSSDHRLAPPTKEMDSTAYVEEAGVHIDPRTVEDTFDYKVTFLILAPNRNLASANAKIAAFNAALYDEEDKTMEFKTVTFYNDYKRVKIVGVPGTITEATKFWRDRKGKVYDIVQVEWTIKVPDPSLCDFNMQSADF